MIKYNNIIILFIFPFLNWRSGCVQLSGGDFGIWVMSRSSVDWEWEDGSVSESQATPRLRDSGWGRVLMMMVWRLERVRLGWQSGNSPDCPVTPFSQSVNIGQTESSLSEEKNQSLMKISLSTIMQLSLPWRYVSVQGLFFFLKYLFDDYARQRQ